MTKMKSFNLRGMFFELQYDIIVENLHGGRKPFSQTNFEI